MGFPRIKQSRATGFPLLAPSSLQGKLSPMSTSGGFEETNSSAGWGAAAEGSVTEQDPLIGKVIGAKYEILSFLGKGGMSVVYRAKQHPINRIVALKMLLAHLSKNEGSVKRFLQEATAAGQLTHPNVVSVFDFGLTEDGQPYLVMDFVEGDSLAQIIAAEGPIAYKEALPLFIQVCEGLTVAHEKGVIHRDIKPSNIVVEETHDGKRARIVDFGIAKMLDAESQQLTKTGEIFGSPFYMSPEQCEGRQLDNRSDIYSLGIVFYEVLSGMVPLAGKSSLETMRLHMEQMPDNFQKSAPASNIPLKLENVVFKMVAKSREKRYPNARAVKADLEQLLDGDANALSGNIEYVSREISRKSKTITAALTTTGVLALLTIVSVLAYPHACTAYAEDQYSKAQKALSKNNLPEAESCLKTSVSFGRSINNVKLESRGLDSLISLLRREGKSEELTLFRKRKQDLIKQELSTLGLTDNYIDSFVGTQVAFENKETEIAMASAARRKSKREVHEETRETGDADSDSLMDLESTKKNASGKLLSKADFYQARRAQQVIAENPIPKSSPATTSTPTPHSPVHSAPVTLSQEPSLAPPPLPQSAVEISDQRSESSKRSRRPAPQYQDLKKAALPFRMQKPGSSGGNEESPSTDARYDGASSDAELKGGRGSSDGGSSSGGSPNYKDESDYKSKQGMVANVRNALMSMAVSADTLERLEVMLDYCIEHNSYERAINCANAAIRMHSMLNYNPDEELAELYATRAFAHFKRNHVKMAKNDIAEALRIVGHEGISVGGAEAETVAAMLFAQNGKHRMAIDQYQHAQTRISDSNSSEIVREGISGLR